MNILFLIILLFLIMISAIMGFYEIMSMKNKIIGEKERIHSYKGIVLEGWIMVAYVILIISISDITVNDVAFKFLDTSIISFNFLTKIVIFILCGSLMILTLYQMIGYMVSKTFRQQLMYQVQKPQLKVRHYEKILSEIILPKTRKEKLWFAFVSATAGIGEEIVYRGFLFYLLIDLFPTLPIYVVLVIAGVIFGIAHIYQGVKGILKTGLVGLLLGSLYIASGLLLPGIILHFIVDFSSNFLLSEETEYTKASSL